MSVSRTTRFEVLHVQLLNLGRAGKADSMLTVESAKAAGEKINAGGTHTLVLHGDGTVAAWGDNSYGQCSVPEGLNGVVSISTGVNHSLALKSDGSVVAWGSNRSGQCTVPAGLSNVRCVSAGNQYSLALKSDGTVVAWGQNDCGQCTVPAGLDGISAVSAMDYQALALKTTGTVLTWGLNNLPLWQNNILAVSGGYQHCLALRGDGTVVAWGLNDHGQSTVPEELYSVVAVATGQYHSMVLKSDGTVVAWGANDFGQCNVPLGLSDVVAITVGRYHSMALKSDGQVVAWGDNGRSQCVVPAGLNITLPSAPVRSPALHSGLSGSGITTSMNVLTFIGIAHTGASVKLYKGPELLGQGTADNNGCWSIAATGLEEGIHTLHLTESHSVCNQSDISASLYITIDMTAATVVTGIKLPFIIRNGMGFSWDKQVRAEKSSTAEVKFN